MLEQRKLIHGAAGRGSKCCDLCGRSKLRGSAVISNHCARHRSFTSWYIFTLPKLILRWHHFICFMHFRCGDVCTWNIFTDPKERCLWLTLGRHEARLCGIQRSLCLCKTLACLSLFKLGDIAANSVSRRFSAVRVAFLNLGKTAHFRVAKGCDLRPLHQLPYRRQHVTKACAFSLERSHASAL